MIPGDEFGLLDVSGAAALAGTLAISLEGGFIPPIGSEFEFLTASSLTGTFDSYNFPDLPGDRYFEIDYTTTAVTLSVIPEPASLLLLALAALALRRR
ncbi:MAG: PEP-CTERM sorting domain-containing protein [Planctomycetota bacterium]